MLSRLPIRPRITAAFAGVMAVLLVVLGIAAYLAMGAALLDEIDTGLRFRAAAIVSAAPTGGVELPDPRLEEPTESISQVVTRSGTVLRGTQGFTSAALLSARDLATVQRATFYRRHIAGIANETRLLAIPITASSDHVLIVATTMADRADALHHLGAVFLIGGPVAIALASLAGWVVAGWSLRPMERMRQQASAITVSGLDRTLSVPPAKDELRRLAETLNDMLARLGRSLDRERAFLETASHELRTPLAALRAELDLALRHQRSADELSAAIRSATQETDRLARLADDLLILARADSGRLPLHRENIALPALLESTAASFAARAAAERIEIAVNAAQGTIDADPLRLRQVLVNLLDNALRYAPAGGVVGLSARLDGSGAEITVTDSGPGFPSDHAERPATGLGLRIVSAIAASHGGSLRIERSPAGGAAVTVVIPGSKSGALV